MSYSDDDAYYESSSSKVIPIILACIGIGLGVALFATSTAIAKNTLRGTAECTVAYEKIHEFGEKVYGENEAALIVEQFTGETAIFHSADMAECIGYSVKTSKNNLYLLCRSGELSLQKVKCPQE